MKTIDEINAARGRIIERLQTPGLSTGQIALLGGVLNALVWCSAGPASSTMERLLSAEPLAVGGAGDVKAMETFRDAIKKATS